MSSMFSCLSAFRAFPNHFQLFPNHPRGFPYRFPFSLFLRWSTHPPQLQESPREKVTDSAPRRHRRNVNTKSVQKQKAYRNVPALSHLRLPGQSCQCDHLPASLALEMSSVSSLALCLSSETLWAPVRHMEAATVQRICKSQSLPSMVRKTASPHQMWGETC